MSSYLSLAAIYVAALAVRTTYELLKSAGRADPRSRALFLTILVDMMLLWASWFALCPIDPVRLALPAAVHWAGLAVLVVGLVMAVGALVQLGGVENIDHLVVTGFFGRVRHPMYLGFVLWILGWSVFHGAVFSFALGLMGIANILVWRHLEELHLEAGYGDAYQSYRARTWF